MDPNSSFLCHNQSHSIILARNDWNLEAYIFSYRHIGQEKFPSSCNLDELPGRIKTVKENVEMSSSDKSESLLDRWFPLLVILFGLLFVTLLVSFHPMG